MKFKTKLKFNITLKYESIVSVDVEADNIEEAQFKAPSVVDEAEIRDNLKRPTVVAVQSYE